MQLEGDGGRPALHKPAGPWIGLIVEQHGAERVLHRDRALGEDDLQRCGLHRTFEGAEQLCRERESTPPLTLHPDDQRTLDAQHHHLAGPHRQAKMAGMQEAVGGLRRVEARLDGLGRDHNAAGPGPGEGGVGEVIRDEQAALQDIARPVPEVDLSVERCKTGIGRLAPHIDCHAGRDHLDVPGDAGEKLTAHLMAGDDDRLGCSGRQHRGEGKRRQTD